MTQSTGDSKTAIPGSNCREVNVSTLQIWDEPGENVIGELQQGQQVYIANEGRGGWVPIELPGSGYVNSASLRLCSNIAASAEEGYFIPVEACRSIATEQVTVRNRPGGEVIATLAKGQSVQIANEGSEGWVPLVYPLEGYITSANLADCAQ
ncbi:MAG: SH3 domain-containing protein [Microcoleaceae cyanobacterium]